MKNKYYCKILSLCSVGLFIGIGIQPAFAFDMNKESIQTNHSDELTEVTIEVYGIRDFSSNTYYLTDEETEKLESIITNYKAKINNAKNIEESEYLLNNTYDKLAKIGLLDSAAVKESIILLKEFFKKIGYDLRENSLLQNDMKIMFLVAIALRADYANFMPSYIAFLYRIYLNYDFFEKNLPIVINIYNIMMNALANFLYHLILIFGTDYWGVFTAVLLSVLWIYFNPFPIGYSVSLSYSNMENHGWVAAIGLLGIQIIEGEYRGALAGFTGIRIFYKSDYYMFGFALGSALQEVDSENLIE